MMQDQRGFTLIEVLVAIVLMAIVSLIAWRGLDGVTRADAHLQDSSTQNADLLRALNQLQRDYALRATSELAEPPPPDAEPDAERREIPTVTLRSSDREPLQLELIRVAASEDGKLQRVRWWVANGTLYRAAGAARSRFPLSAPKDSVAVLGGLEKVQMRVWRSDRGWSQLAGNREDNPLGLELRFNRRGGQGMEPYRQVLVP